MPIQGNFNNTLSLRSNRFWASRNEVASACRLLAHIVNCPTCAAIWTYVIYDCHFNQELVSVQYEISVTLCTQCSMQIYPISCTFNARSQRPCRSVSSIRSHNQPGSFEVEGTRLALTKDHACRLRRTWSSRNRCNCQPHEEQLKLTLVYHLTRLE